MSAQTHDDNVDNSVDVDVGVDVDNNADGNVDGNRQSPAATKKGYKTHPHHIAGPPARPNYARRRFNTPAEVRALLNDVLDAQTAADMVYALRRRIRKGNVTTLEFLFAYLLGRPAVVVQHSADEKLAEFIADWRRLQDESADDTIDGQYRMLSAPEDTETDK